MTTPARPKYVRITDHHYAYYVTVGRVYRVLDWDGTRPVIRNNDATMWPLATAGGAGSWFFPAWEPCEEPADGSGKEDPS